MSKPLDLATRLGRVIEHLTQGEVVELLTKPTPEAVADYRWCRTELIAIYRQLPKGSA